MRSASQWAGKGQYSLAGKCDMYSPDGQAMPALLPTGRSCLSRVSTACPVTGMLYLMTEGREATALFCQIVALMSTMRYMSVLSMVSMHSFCMVQLLRKTDSCAENQLVSACHQTARSHRLPSDRLHLCRLCETMLYKPSHVPPVLATLHER